MLLGNDRTAVEACLSQGLKVYLCCGAFGTDSEKHPGETLAEDIYGKRQEWFSSGCPNNAAIRERNLREISRLCKTEGADGVIIDGARFASPFSSWDIQAFFTCFCKDCEQKAGLLGFHFGRMKQGALALYEFSVGKRESCSEHLGDIASWLEFRRVCTTEHLRNFSQAVKKESPGLETGAFLFSPSIAWMVGQSYGDLKGCLDIFVPMIYRAYKQDYGPACLNHELSRLAALLSGSGRIQEKRIIGQLASFTGLDLDGFSSAEDILKGLPPEIVGAEVKKAMQTVGGMAKTVPILDFNDDRLNHSIVSARQAGAADVALFAYEKERFDKQKQTLSETI